MSKSDPIYNAGYNKAMGKVRHLDAKYSQMWCEANRWQIPSKLHMPLPSRADDRERMFVSGAWAVLEALRQDGVLSEDTIDKFWEKMHA